MELASARTFDALEQSIAGDLEKEVEELFTSLVFT